MVIYRVVLETKHTLSCFDTHRRDGYSPVMFFTPGVVTSRRTTKEVAPWGPSRNLSVTYSKPLLRNCAPSLSASSAVTWKPELAKLRAELVPTTGCGGNAFVTAREFTCPTAGMLVLFAWGLFVNSKLVEARAVT